MVVVVGGGGGGRIVFCFAVCLYAKSSYSSCVVYHNTGSLAAWFTTILTVLCGFSCVVYQSSHTK